MLDRLKFTYLRRTMKLSETIDLFVSEGRNYYRKQTLKAYGRNLRRFCRFLGDPPVVAITKKDGIRFLNSLDDVTKKTRANYYTPIRTLWDWLVENDYAEENILETVKPPKPEKTTMNPLTEPEMKALFEAAHHSGDSIIGQTRVRKWMRGLLNVRDPFVVAIFANTGLRVTELADRRIGDLQGRAGDYFIIITSGKMGKDRIVPVSDEVVKLAFDYFEYRKWPPESAPLVAAQDSPDDEERFINIRQIERTIRKIGKAAKIQRRVHPHLLRHSFAIAYLRNDGKEFALPELMGHASMHSTKIYARMAHSDVKRSHRKAAPFRDIFAESQEQDAEGGTIEE